MKFKSFLLPVCLFLFPVLNFSQISFTSSQDDYFELFQKTKTVVLLTGEEIFDGKLKKAVEENWTHSEVVFAESGDRDNYLDEKKYHFISHYNYTVEGLTTHGWAVYFQGDVMDYPKMTHLIAFFPIDYGGISKVKAFGAKDRKVGAAGNTTYTGQDKILTDYAYKINLMIKSLNDITDFVKQESFKSSYVYEQAINRFKKAYNKVNFEPTMLGGKKLLVSNKTFSGKFTSAVLRKIYKGEVKIVSHEVFKELVETKPEGYVALLSNATPFRTFCLYDFSLKKIIYSDMVMHASLAKEFHHDPYQFKGLK